MQGDSVGTHLVRLNFQLPLVQTSRISGGKHQACVASIVALYDRQHGPFEGDERSHLVVCVPVIGLNPGGSFPRLRRDLAGRHTGQCGCSTGVAYTIIVKKMTIEPLCVNVRSLGAFFICDLCLKW